MPAITSPRAVPWRLLTPGAGLVTPGAANAVAARMRENACRHAPAGKAP